jgi:hypothetical protein
MLVSHEAVGKLRGNDRESAFFSQKDLREMQDCQKAGRVARDL